MYLITNMNFLCQGFRKLSSNRHTYIHTDRLTDTTEIIYTVFQKSDAKIQVHGGSEYGLELTILLAALIILFRM